MLGLEECRKTARRGYCTHREDEPGEKALNNFRAAIKKLLIVIEDDNPRTR
jgi:hypothetical protein